MENTFTTTDTGLLFTRPLAEWKYEFHPFVDGGYELKCWGPGEDRVFGLSDAEFGKWFRELTMDGYKVEVVEVME